MYSTPNCSVSVTRFSVILWGKLLQPGKKIEVEMECFYAFSLLREKRLHNAEVDIRVHWRTILR